ncbi:hypothetical protein Bbelb_111110 [Branchiostoma belcheri]|nr:hypothetical protein Bbelb_111110 [Branchiostoma belcheri]
MPRIFRTEVRSLRNGDDRSERRRPFGEKATTVQKGDDRLRDGNSVVAPPLPGWHQNNMKRHSVTLVSSAENGFSTGSPVLNDSQHWASSAGEGGEGSLPPTGGSDCRSGRKLTRMVPSWLVYVRSYSRYHQLVVATVGADFKFGRRVCVVYRAAAVDSGPTPAVDGRFLAISL